MLNAEFKKESLEMFSGCDSNEEHAGTPDNPSIWLFGIEFGTYKSKHADPNRRESSEDDNYSVKTQLKWPYNRKAFKLLAAMNKDYGVERHLEFAKDFMPFVTGSPGFFKGNIYPYPCSKVTHWPESAIKTTGAYSKKEYLDWCKEHRIPVINAWVEKYHPKIFIGVGITNRHVFSDTAFGKEIDLHEKNIVINGHNKRLFHYIEGDKKLVVIPHFSGPHGLNSDESLQLAGEFISSLIESEHDN